MQRMNSDPSKRDYEGSLVLYLQVLEIINCDQALFGLANVYVSPSSPIQDHVKAFSILSNLAHKGYRGAFFGLGLMYAGGLGTEKNLRKSIFYLKKAAEMGHFLAQNQLGLIQLENHEYVTGGWNKFVGLVKSIYVSYQNRFDSRISIEWDPINHLWKGNG